MWAKDSLAKWVYLCVLPLATSPQAVILYECNVCLGLSVGVATADNVLEYHLIMLCVVSGTS